MKLSTVIILASIIVILGATSIIAGLSGHAVVACITGYLAALALVLSVNHGIHVRNRKYEESLGLRAAHGCYEMDQEE